MPSGKALRPSRQGREATRHLAAPRHSREPDEIHSRIDHLARGPPKRLYSSRGPVAKRDRAQARTREFPGMSAPTASGKGYLSGRTVAPGHDDRFRRHPGLLTPDRPSIAIRSAFGSLMYADSATHKDAESLGNG